MTRRIADSINQCIHQLGYGFNQRIVIFRQGHHEMMHKPAIAPPGWVFGPVWTFLYILMGIAAYKVFGQAGQEEVRDSLPLLCIPTGVQF